MRYYASPVSPTPDCITRKFREFIGGIQVAPRISFRQMPDMGLGKSLSYVFVPAYSASQILCFVLFVVFELLQSQVLIPYLSSGFLIFSMGVLILLDH